MVVVILVILLPFNKHCYAQKTEIILPSVNRLGQISSGKAVKTGKLVFDYLQTRTAGLTQQEHIVTLIFDGV